ncbi:MAG TPA: hypothetical protein VFY87_07995, partial [Geminicoccaceae bacterium]|nr:hypothetical protein [Geminicoccaceae bacterium]
LIAARPYRLPDADHQAMVDFLAHGAVYGPGTFVKGVRRLQATEILTLDAGSNAGPVVRPKAAAEPAGDATEAVLSHFADLVRSLGSQRVSVDLTGGFDSRVVACLLHRQGLAFEGSISGRADNPDVEIAAQAARLLGCPFEVTPHDVDRLEEDLPLVFSDGDGLTDVRRFHRDRQNSLARLARGVETIVHGGAGEFFRDHNFVQDFPRYGSSRVDLQRYYRLRVCAVQLPDTQLTDRGAELLSAARQHVLSLLEKSRMSTNNETYERFFYAERAPDFYGQFFSNHINLGLGLAAPFLDHRINRAASAIPPWRRFFQRWHRQILTRHCPALAALPTPDGFSASNEWRHVVGDLWSFGGTQASRAARKVTQRLLGKALFYKMGAFAADAPGYMAGLRATRAFSDARDRLVAAGILRPNLAQEQIRDVHVGRIVTAGMLLGRLDGQGR